MSDDLLEKAKRAGLLGGQDWNSLLKTLGSYGSPQAKRLYDRINKKYNIPKVDQVIKKGTTNMADETETPVTPEVPETPVTPDPTPAV